MDPALIAEGRRPSLGFFDVPEPQKQAPRPPAGTFRHDCTRPDMRSMFAMGRAEADGKQYAEIPQARADALPGTVAPGEAPRHAPVLAGVQMSQKISAVRRPVVPAKQEN